VNRAPAKTQAALLERWRSDRSRSRPVPHAARSVHRHRDAEPGRVRGNLPASRGRARPLPLQGGLAYPRQPEEAAILRRHEKGRPLDLVETLDPLGTDATRHVTQRDRERHRRGLRRRLHRSHCRGDAPVWAISSSRESARRSPPASRREGVRRARRARFRHTRRREVARAPTLRHRVRGLKAEAEIEVSTRTRRFAGSSRDSTSPLIQPPQTTKELAFPFVPLPRLLAFLFCSASSPLARHLLRAGRVGSRRHRALAIVLA